MQEQDMLCVKSGAPYVEALMLEPSGSYTSATGSRISDVTALIWGCRNGKPVCLCLSPSV